jgi:hypothetical protein
MYWGVLHTEHLLVISEILGSFCVPRAYDRPVSGVITMTFTFPFEGTIREMDAFLGAHFAT